MVKYGWGLILLGWLLLMFLFSSQPYEKQDLRDWLGRAMAQTGWQEPLSDVAFTYGGRVIGIQTLGAGGFAEFFVRKAAHLLEYAILGGLLLLFLRAVSRGGLLSAPLTIGIIAALAAADEYRQSFIAGRTPLPDDVMLDILGACLGVLLTLLILFARPAVVKPQTSRNPKERIG